MNSPERRAALLGALLAEYARRQIRAHAWVVLPNHYHVLVTAGDWAMLAETIRAVHGPTARSWNLQDGTPGRQVWFQYADRAMRSEAHYYTTLNYIHFNAVKHGWASKPEEWDETSVHGYLQKHGREWLRETWMDYPLQDYGRGWDDDPAVKGEASVGTAPGTRARSREAPSTGR